MKAIPSIKFADWLWSAMQIRDRFSRGEYQHHGVSPHISLSSRQAENNKSTCNQEAKPLVRQSNSSRLMFLTLRSAACLPSSSASTSINGKKILVSSEAPCRMATHSEIIWWKDFMSQGIKYPLYLTNKPPDLRSSRRFRTSARTPVLVKVTQSLYSTRAMEVRNALPLTGKNSTRR